VGLAGAAIVIAALCIGTAGARAEFKSRIELKEKPRWFVTLLGCVGYLTRAVVFAIIGVFLVFAAIHSNAHEASDGASPARLSDQAPKLWRPAAQRDRAGVSSFWSLRRGRSNFSPYQ